MFDGEAGAGAGGAGGDAGVAVVDSPGAGTVVEEEVTTDGGADGGGDAAGAGEGGDGTGAGQGDDAAKPGEGDEKPGEDDDVDPDGRKVDAKTRNAIAKLKKVDPAAAKAVRDAYFQRQAYEKEFPSVQAAREARATLEELGGEEGIAEIRTELSDWRNEAEQMANGDPALVTSLYEANPDSLVLNVQNALTLMQGKDLTRFDNAILPAFVDRIEKAGFPQALGELSEFIKNGKGQEAYDLVQKLGAWFADTKKKAGDLASKREAPPDPRARELDERENRLKQQETQNYNRAISNSVTRLNNASLEKLVEPLAKQLKLNDEGKRDFVQGLTSKIYKAMKEDKTFQKMANALKAKGDPQRTANFISGKFAELLPEYFRRHRNANYPNIDWSKAGSGAAANNGKKADAAKPGEKRPAVAAPNIRVAGGDPKATLITKKPSPDQIDWTKTTDEMFHIGRGMAHAYLKNGKYVKFDWKTVQV